jgi:GMP synthase (glutamine-hydrolysing)
VCSGDEEFFFTNFSINKYLEKSKGGNMKTKKIVLIDILDDPPFNITEIFQDVLNSAGIDGKLLIGVSGLSNSLQIPEDLDIQGVIISGSVHHVIEDCHTPWGKSLAQFIRQHYDKIPLLGVCYGHQALAFALGGKVDVHPLGREIGSVQLSVTEEAGSDMLFSGFKSGDFVQESHLDQVTVLPEGATLLAFNQHSPIQAFRIGKSWGIQFYPELTPALFSKLLSGRVKSFFADDQKEEANKLSKVIEAIRPCPQAVSVLSRFILHCVKGGKDD